MTRGFVFFNLTVVQPIEKPVNWDAIVLIWRHCNEQITTYTKSVKGLQSIHRYWDADHRATIGIVGMRNNYKTTAHHFQILVKIS